jgi:hypothetical protein
MMVYPFTYPFVALIGLLFMLGSIALLLWFAPNAKEPGASLAWTFVLLAILIFGAILLLFGVNHGWTSMYQPFGLMPH